MAGGAGDGGGGVNVGGARARACMRSSTVDSLAESAVSCSEMLFRNCSDESVDGKMEMILGKV